MEVEVGVEIFPFVKAGAGHDAAVAVEDLQQRGLAVLAVEPAVGRSVVLPELADLLDLRGTHGVRKLAARGERRQTLTQSIAMTRRAGAMAKPWRLSASEAARPYEQRCLAVRSRRRVAATERGSGGR
jgi:hypothetical protein